jgi:leucyl aminopeptidase
LTTRDKASTSTPVRIRVRAGDVRFVGVEMVVVPLAAGAERGAAVRLLTRGRGGAAVRRAIAAERFHGREGQVVVLPLAQGRRRLLCLVGLGEHATSAPDVWRRAAGHARHAADRAGATRVAVVAAPTASDVTHLAAIAEGFALAGYRFDKYKSDADAPARVAELTLIARELPPAATLTARLDAVAATVTAVETVRDLVNEPAGVKTPTFLAETAERLAAEAGIEVEIWDRARIEREGLAGLMAVARGSQEEPRFIRLRYRGKGARRRVALVGKGVTFDSGGLSLKPAKAMETMKCDMAGGAAVIATLAALGKIRPAIDVDGFVPATENLPSGAAQKPGDVIRFRNGKTVEVLNTDAEGRLILADALAMAAASKPDVIIDLATLTGACMVALGTQVAGIYGNDQTTVDRLIAFGTETGEPLWQMPLVADYRDDIKSPVADFKNIGGGHAGSITAALFLQEFVDGTPWVHLDIAGPAFADKDLPYMPKGGTGFGVRTLLRYLDELAAAPAIEGSRRTAAGSTSRAATKRAAKKTGASAKGARASRKPIAPATRRPASS